MSNVLERMKDMLESELCETELEIYSCGLNGSTFSGHTEAKLDRDGDLCISLNISEEELCDHISPDVMKKYLEDEGHL